MCVLSKNRHIMNLWISIYMVFGLLIPTSEEMGDPEIIHHANTTNQLAHWNFGGLRNKIMLTIFLLAVIIMKMTYKYLDILSSFIPESCMLILVGIISGALIKHGGHENLGNENWSLIPELFFFILLPPIVLDAAHGLCHRAFADVIGPVMLFAIVTTTLNFLIIGFALFGLSTGGAMGGAAMKYSPSHFLLFSSLIVAVDPVAVLAIFEEIGVDKTLYFLVFGESLFNDAVTIVLYNMMVTFVNMEKVGTVPIVIGILSFFTVSVGGALVGLIFGILSCLLTRYSSHCVLLQPSIIIIIAYLSYLTGDLFGWSGIISMIACGILQAIYAFHNMTSKSVLVTRRVIKLTSNISEAIVFLYLGIEVTKGNFIWDTGFILWSLALCVITRFLITFALSGMLNISGVIVKRISFTEQFIIGYGGLRGAVAFSLASLIDDDIFTAPGLQKKHFLTATLFVILFTIFPMGITIKPLVKQLKIKLETGKSLSLLDEINDNVTDHFTAAIEAITGMKGHNLLRERLDNIDLKYVRPFLQNNPDEHNQRIVGVYEKIALTLNNAGIEKTQWPSKGSDDQMKMKSSDFDRQHRMGAPDINVGLMHLLSLVNPDREHCTNVTSKSFATRRFSLFPNADKDDYKELLKRNASRRDAIRSFDVHSLPHERHAEQIHNVVRKKAIIRLARRENPEVNQPIPSDSLSIPVKTDRTSQSSPNNDISLEIHGNSCSHSSIYSQSFSLNNNQMGSERQMTRESVDMYRIPPNATEEIHVMHNFPTKRAGKYDISDDHVI